MMEQQGVELSVVLPVFNEADGVGLTLDSVLSVLRGLDRSFELICVDDGSSDGTLDRVQAIAAGEPALCWVSLSRNFGKEAALLAGLEVASGRAVVTLDGDLQHPPELIPALLEYWGQGYEVVEAVKAERGREGRLYGLLAQGFNGVMGRAIGRSLRGASDFKLLDRQVVDAVLACPERNRFFRGLVAWVGFRVAQVPFQVEQRRQGRSKWSTRDLLHYSLKNLIAFSSLPLRAVAWLGAGAILLSIVLALQTLYNYFSGVAIGGFTTVILLMILLGSIIIACLGVVAIYLADMFDELKARPVYIRKWPRTPERGRPQDG